MTAPRVVVVHRATELAGLLARHGSHGQAAFFLRSRGRRIEDLMASDDQQRQALATVSAGIDVDWRRASVERDELSRFLFGPEDIVVTVGADGLVANVARYLDGQPVVGVNTDPDRNPGVLVPHAPGTAGKLLRRVVRDSADVTARTMAQLDGDDGQQLLALNEIYLGQPGQSTARYRLERGEESESQASSGLIAATGTGATGWAASIHRAYRSVLDLPAADQASLAWFVREAWPSPATGTTLTQGVIEVGRSDSGLRITVESDSLVAFGDGGEADRLTFSWGQQVTVGIAREVLHWVAG